VTALPGTPAAARLLREVTLRQLLTLDAGNELTTEHVRLAAHSLGVSERTMWRWVRRARSTGVSAPVSRPRLVIDTELRQRLAYWRGNVTALHRELVGAARNGGPPAPSLATLHRAVQRDLSPGERAGLRKGEHARRGFDVFLQRPSTYRNAVWEADHLQTPVEVDVAGELVKPWITWFVDVASNAVCGTAVTAGPPSRESILAALRAAILLEAPYGPPGGLPERVRVDRGKDFLSRTVTEALGAFAVGVEDLPGHHPHLKGTVEALNGAVEQMFLAGLPRYVHAQRLVNRQVADVDQPPLAYERFVAELLGWVGWWNTEHAMLALAGRTPLAAWLDDPTPLRTVSSAEVWLFTLEDDGRDRKILTKGISWRRRLYVADWMTGHMGRRVRLRHMPHHDHEIEVLDARAGSYLGRAFLADQASPEQVAAVRRARAVKQRRLRADLRAAERTRRQRYAASTVPQPPRPVGAITAAEAAAELAEVDDEALARLARPALLPPGPPAAGWVLPRTRRGER